LDFFSQLLLLDAPTWHNACLCGTAERSYLCWLRYPVCASGNFWLDSNSTDRTDDPTFSSAFSGSGVGGSAVNEICATIWKYFQLAHLSHIYVLCRSSVLYALGVLLFASSACAQQQCTSNNAGQCVQAGPITTNGCSINPLEVVALQATLAATDPVAALAANCADPNNPACGKYTNFSNFPLLGPTSANGPCDHHDYCYASCWALSSDGTFTKHKSTCDAAFASELQTVCDTAELLGDSPAVIRACRFFARAYSGVKLVSASTYANDQAQACLFCPGSPRVVCSERVVRRAAQSAACDQLR
jgi:hypothetical protein